ncbi:MAG: ATP-binding protein [Planctomycetota bacterium]|jgi:signal transduction histidine kinase
MSAGENAAKKPLLTIHRCITLILGIGILMGVVTVYALERLRSRSAETERVLSEIHLPAAERATRVLQHLESYTTSLLVTAVGESKTATGLKGLAVSRDPAMTLQLIDKDYRALAQLEEASTEPSVRTLYTRGQELAQRFRKLTTESSQRRIDLVLCVQNFRTTLEQSRKLHLALAEEIRTEQILRTDRNTLQFLGFLVITLAVGGFAIFRLMGLVNGLIAAESRARLEFQQSNRQLEEKMSQSAELEEQLRHAQKMEAIGKLSGGIAHDFNNILTSILGRTELAMATVERGSRIYEYLQAIEKAGEDAAELVKQLLAFSRKQDLKPRVLDLNEVLQGMEGMLKSLIGPEIVLEMHLNPDLGHVRADSSQISQVVMNLASNARDAMHGGGQLHMSTGNVVLDTATTENELTLMPGQYIQLIVSDTGMGMEENVRKRIFDPYFTTKDTGEGLGLGLSTVFGIINQSHGHISVDAVPGKGSKFKILLPRVFQPLDPKEEAEGSLANLGGSETILLVEDDESVRNLTSEILQDHGYKCIEATGPEEALALIFQENIGFDLLITDVLMPKMTGRELAQKVLADRPGTPVLYISGYSEEHLEEPEDASVSSVLVHKPFTTHELLESMRRILEPDESGLA